MPGIQIIGAGNNVAARVTDLGLLQNQSVAIEMPHHVNLEHENAYVISFQVIPSDSTAEVSTFFYMRNESETPLIMETAKIFSATADEIIYLSTNPTGTPTGGDNATPVNSNLGSNKKAVGLFVYGSDLGGLDGGNFYGRSYFAAGKPIEYVFRNWIIMPRNTSFMMCAENGGSELTVTIPFFYVVG